MNKLAKVSFSASYSDPDDQAASIARANVSAPYTQQSHNEVAVADGVGPTTFDVDFGAVVAGATFVIVRNLTANTLMPAGQDLMLTVNGSGDLFRVPAGGAVAFAIPLAAGGTPVVSMTLASTLTQVGDGKFSSHVFGDPE